MEGQGYLVLEVSLYPYSRSGYVSQLYSGLFELRAQDRIALRWPSLDSASSLPDIDLNDLPKSTALIQLTDPSSGLCRKIGFDFMDGGAIDSPQLLEFVDVYFKRSFRPTWYESLGENLAKKIQPFGLHFACASPHQRYADELALIRSFSRLRAKQGESGLFESLDSTYMGALLKLAAHTKRGGWRNRLPNAEKLRTAIDPTVNRSIYYRTRVYRPTKTNPLRGAVENEARVAIIRALKKEFGARFIGGLRASEYAKQMYPDCIFPYELDWAGHLRCVRENMICVTSAGLFDSTDWKLSEYLAASRCTVSENIKFELPKKLEHEREAMLFTTPDQCVENCAKVLGDSQLACSLSHHASEYYRRHVAPDSTVLRCLNVALS